MEKLTGRCQSVGRRDEPRTVHRLISNVLHELCLGKNCITNNGSKTRLVNQRTEVVLVRQAQGLVMFIEPVHRLL